MSKVINKFLKAYNNNSKKYNNKLFDILSIKLFFFYEFILDLD
jgi:hypothetical protein